MPWLTVDLAIQSNLPSFPKNLTIPNLETRENGDFEREHSNKLVIMLQDICFAGIMYRKMNVLVLPLSIEV